MLRERITPPPDGWHPDTAEILDGRELSARALTAKEFFDIDANYGKDPLRVSHEVLNIIVSLGDDESDNLEELLMLPLRDFSYINECALNASGINMRPAPEAPDPKPSAT